LARSFTIPTPKNWWIAYKIKISLICKVISNEAWIRQIKGLIKRREIIIEKHPSASTNPVTHWGSKIGIFLFIPAKVEL
jgi:hypothetical protein